MGEKYAPPGAADYKAPTAEKLVKLATSKIDESPAQIAHYEKFSGYLNAYLDTKIKPSDLGSEERRLKDEKNSRENITDDELIGTDSALRAIRLLGQLKVSSRREGILEDLAKKQVAEVAEMEKNSWRFNKTEIRDAVYQLNEAVSSLAQARFPKELESQSSRMGMTEEQIRQARDQMSKTKIR